MTVCRCLETIDRALEADTAGAPPVDAALAQADALAETLELNTTVVASSDITVILPSAPLGDVAAIGTVLQEEARQPVPYCVVAKVNRAPPPHGEQTATARLSPGPLSCSYRPRNSALLT